MNERERALAAMRGEPVDRVPFIGRMDLWYSFHRAHGSLPAPYQTASLWDLQRDLGIGISAPGAWLAPFYKLEYDGVEVETWTAGSDVHTRHHTPHGTLSSRDTTAEELAGAVAAGARMEYPFKSAADYDALQFLVEHTRVVENFEAYARSVEVIGDDGLAMGFCGVLPAHQLMLKLMGYETFYCELHDNGDRVEALLQALTHQYREILALAAGCPAQALQVGANYDEQMTPPPAFRLFFAPLYREARPQLSAAGKILVVHGDGEMSGLLAELMECGVQVVEAFTPAPATSIDIRATRALWRDRVTMWGGLPFLIFTDAFSDEQFERYLEGLLAAVAPGDRFILGFGDNVPTDALFRRIVRAAQFWAQHSRYPIAGFGPPPAGG